MGIKHTPNKFTWSSGTLRTSIRGSQAHSLQRLFAERRHLDEEQGRAATHGRAAYSSYVSGRDRGSDTAIHPFLTLVENAVIWMQNAKAPLSGGGAYRDVREHPRQGR